MTLHSRVGPVFATPCRAALGVGVAAILILGSAATGHADDTSRAALEPEQIVALLKSKDPEERLRGATAAQECPSATLTSPLIRVLKDDSVIVRLAVIDALGVRVDKAGRKKAAALLAGRVDGLEKKSSDREELLATLTAIRTLAQPGPIKGLIHGIKTDSDIEVVQARLFAVAQVPHKDAIERLIQFLGKGRRGGALRQQRSAAAKALQYATGQSARGLGNDPDKWRAWWRENEKTFDFEAVAAARVEAARAAEEKRQRQKERREKRKKGGEKGKKKGNKDGKKEGSDA